MRADPSVADPAPAAWRRFAVTLVAATGLLLAGYLALALAVDPYDTGRPRLLARDGVRPQGPRTATASRGRDPAFTAAVVGNSHIQLVSPSRLREATGLPFVQLAVPGTGPGEQLLVADYFLRHHPHARALVLGVDSAWCTGDPALPPLKPFPSWLLADGEMGYLRGLLRIRVAAEVVNRIGWALRKAPRRAVPDGYWDYEPDYLALGAPTDRAGRGSAPGAPRTTPTPARADPPSRRPNACAPWRGASIPRPGSSCSSRPSTLRPGTGRARPGQPRAPPAARPSRQPWRRGAASSTGPANGPNRTTPALFFDATHYRQPLARRIEADIAAALRASPEGGTEAPRP